MEYTEWMEEGKRNIVKKALSVVSATGLSGSHHFYITFRTHFPGVSIPEDLHEEYPEEMTIVLHDAFWALTMSEESFSVDLLFNNKRKTLRIPFKALVSFIDPSVEFVLQFDWESVEPPLNMENVIFLHKFRPKAEPSL